MLTSLVYDLPQDVLNTLTPKEVSEAAPDQERLESRHAEGPIERTAENAVSSRSCSLCGVFFQTVEDQRSHSKSDLHGYNLRQRLRGMKTVTEVDFEKLIEGTTSSVADYEASANVR